MEEKTREELVAEFAKKIFDESYFSVFSDEDVFYQAAEFLEENGIPVSDLDKEIKKLHTQYRGSRPNAKDNVFDIIGDEFSSADVGKAREAFKFDIPKEVKQRAEDKKAEEQAEAAEQEQPVAEEAANNKPAPAPASNQAPAPARVPAPEPNLDNPAGLLAMAKNQGPINPKDKSLDAFQRGNIQKALNAQAARQIDDDIAKKRRSDRIQKIFDDREADLKESWARSRTGRMDGRPWDQLDEDTKSEMRGRFMDARANSAYTDEKYKAYKEKTKDPLEKEYERKLKALQESRAMPPQDPFTEETKTDAMLTQSKGPESFELFFAEDPKNEPGYASSDSKPFSVDTTSKEDFGPRRKFIFTDPTRPEKPREPESFELFMPQNESGYASSDSKPFSVDTAANPAESNRFLSKEFLKQGEERARELLARQRDSRYQLPAYSQQTLDAPAPVSLSSATSNGFSLNTKDSSAPDPNSPVANSERQQLLNKQPASPVINSNPTPQDLFNTLPYSPIVNSDRQQLLTQKPDSPIVNSDRQQLLTQKPDSPIVNSDRQNAFTSLEEAKKVNQLKSQLDLIDMQKSKAQNLADTRDFYSRKAPRFEKIGGVIRQTYDPYSLDTMKARQTVMEGIQNSKTGDPFQDHMDQKLEEEERKRRQRQFVAESKKSPFYTNYFSS